MPPLSKLIICLVIATPLSALYHGTTQTGALAFALNATAAGAFIGTALLCVFICSLGGGQSAPAAGQDRSKSGNTRPPKKRAATGGREAGTVKWFNGGKGFGFITRENGEEIFVHFRSVQKDSRRLAPGLNVEFAVTEGAKGPEASDVTVV